MHIKAVSDDATSLMRFGFIKLVSSCDRAKNVSQETFKSPVQLFLRQSTALFLQLVSCDFSLSANQILDYFNSMGGNLFLYLASTLLQYSLTIYILVYISIHVKCERYINTY